MTEEKVVPGAPHPSVVAADGDERIDFIREQAFQSLKLQSEKWNRFVAVEENQRLLIDFLDKPQHGKLLLFTGPGGALHADVQVSLTWKTKIFYIFKKCARTISKNAFKNELLLGEISSNPVEHLTVIINEVKQVKQVNT